MQEFPQNLNGDQQQFRTTHWSVVKEAGGALDELGTQRAREVLCRTYWKPVVALLTAKGLAKVDAEDLTQDFFQHLLAGDRLSRVSAEGGRFRVWLRHTVENFRITAYRRRMTAKRGGEALHEPADEGTLAAELPKGASQEDAYVRVFDRAWASAVVDSAAAALRKRYAADGQMPLFEALAPSVLPDGLAHPPSPLDESLGLTAVAARKARERFRRRFRDALRTEVSRTVAEPDMVEEELQYLRRVLGA